jgi:hypothetical protein
MTRDEARRIAAYIVKLPGLLGRPQYLSRFPHGCHFLKFKAFSEQGVGVGIGGLTMFKMPAVDPLGVAFIGFGIFAVLALMMLVY